MCTVSSQSDLNWRIWRIFRRVLRAGCAKPGQIALDTRPGRHSGLAGCVTRLGWLWICAWGAGGLAWPGWPLIPAMPGLCLCSFGFGSYHVLLLRFVNHNISRNFSKSSNHRLLWALASFLSRLSASECFVLASVFLLW